MHLKRGKPAKKDIKFLKLGNAGAPGALALLMGKWCYGRLAAPDQNTRSRATSTENTELCHGLV